MIIISQAHEDRPSGAYILSWSDLLLLWDMYQDVVHHKTPTNLFH